jgi:hypothetical protein
MPSRGVSTGAGSCDEGTACDSKFIIAETVRRPRDGRARRATGKKRVRFAKEDPRQKGA